MTVSKGLTERRSLGILEVEEKTGTMGKFTARTLAILLVAALLAGHVLPAASAAQGPGVDGEVDSLLARMSPAERVGQLFLVSFPGQEVSEGSAIATLIQQYRIGGVLLTAANQSLEGGELTGEAVSRLAASLQALTFSPVALVTPTLSPTATATATTSSPAPTATPPPSEESPPTTESVESPTPLASETPTATPTISETAVPTPTLALTAEATAAVGPAGPRTLLPLFIGIARDDLQWVTGDGAAAARLGLMGVGATWSEELTADLGILQGQWLQSMGVNMLLGPALDLSGPYRAGQAGDLGTNSLGESAFWVGSLGRAYIRGLHVGSEGRLLAVASHFPGLGGVDRDVKEEVPLIQFSLQSRLNADLQPFIRVVQSEQRDTAAVADGILVTHVQFRSVAEGIQMTRPASLDPQALDYVLSLPEVKAWRSGGGLLVSDSLGMTSVKRFYDPQMASFQARRVAYDAFLAGNDLLWLDSFGAEGDWADHFRNVRSTLEFFQSKYATDPAFQARVDASVRRILLAKRKLYSRFSLDAVSPLKPSAALSGEVETRIARITSASVSLIYPRPDELPSRIQTLPGANEQILLFEDVRTLPVCDTCPAHEVPKAGVLFDLLRRLYGDEGSGQVNMDNVQAYSFGLLWQYLREPEALADAGAQIEDAILKADWLVFLTEGEGWGSPPEAQALRELLQTRWGVINGKRIVVIGTGAPYYLDSTDLAKLSAYYAVYSNAEVAIEAGLRALFREAVPSGKPPVSVPSVGYVLSEQLKPDPTQLLYVQPVGLAETGASGRLNIGLGDELTLRSGAILDRLGHLVADGTPVTFHFAYPELKLSWQQQEATEDGRAQAKVLLDTAGILEISISTEGASRGAVLIVTIRGGEPATISTVVPTPVPTATARPTAGAVFPVPPDEPTNSAANSAGMDLLSLLLSLVGLTGICAFVWAWERQRGTTLLAAEIALLAFSAGMLGYVLYAAASLWAGQMPLLEGGLLAGLSWRWQPALAAWAMGGATGLAGLLWPKTAARVARFIAQSRDVQ